MPVAIIGTFAVMAAIGFSLNNLTLFGLVLAIGIVVDDAIVVVEAVEHHIEHGLTPHDATIKAMEQVSGPVIAIGLVLSAVFVPCAFITRHHRPVLPPVRPDHRRLDGHLGVQLADAQPGAVGAAAASRARRAASKPLPWLAFAADRRLARPQARLHWAGRGLASRCIVQLPAGAGYVLRALVAPIAVGGCAGGRWSGWFVGRPLNFLLGWSFRVFNRGFDFSHRRLHADGVGVCCASALLVLLVYGGLLVLTWCGFTHTPTGFIPQQDKGYLLVNVQLPDAAVGRRARRRSCSRSRRSP